MKIAGPAGIVFLLLWLSFPVVAENPEFHRINGLLFADGEAFSGTRVTVWKSGTLRSVTEYLDGLRNGSGTGYWPGGELQYQRMYIQDQLHGLSREWYPNGQLRYLQNYSWGHEAGLQQGWHEDGSAAFAYAYREGRRYGVIASKPCYSANPEAEFHFDQAP